MGLHLEVPDYIKRVEQYELLNFEDWVKTERTSNENEQELPQEINQEIQYPILSLEVNIYVKVPNYIL